jgi:hypothetical protein
MGITEKDVDVEDRWKVLRGVGGRRVEESGGSGGEVERKWREAEGSGGGRKEVEAETE